MMRIKVLLSSRRMRFNAGTFKTLRQTQALPRPLQYAFSAPRIDGRRVARQSMRFTAFLIFLLPNQALADGVFDPYANWLWKARIGQIESFDWLADEETVPEIAYYQEWLKYSPEDLDRLWRYDNSDILGRKHDHAPKKD